MDEQPKIIVDSDWKQEAQAEKARLAEETKAGEEGKEEGKQRPIDITDLIQSLASQALMYLGGIPDPETGRAMVAPDMAKMSIDMLGVLEEKTKGNLSEDESKLLESMLRELRFQFVEVSKAIAQAVQEGKIKPQSLTPPPAGE